MDPLQPWVDPSEMRRLAEALMLPSVKEPSAPDDAGFGGDFVGYDVHGAVAAVAAKTPLSPTIAAAPVMLNPAPVVPAKPVEIAPPTVAVVAPPPLPISPRPQPPVAEVVSASPPLTAVVKTTAPLPAQQQEPPTPDKKSMLEQIAEVAQRAQQHLLVQAASIVEPASAAVPAREIPAPVVPVPAVPAPAPAPQQRVAPVVVRGPFLERVTRFRDGLRAQFAVKGVFILDREGAVIFDEADHSRFHFMARSLAMAAKKTTEGPGNVHVKVGSTTMLEVIPVDTVFGRIVLGMLVEQPLSAESVMRIIHALQVATAPPNH